MSTRTNTLSRSSITSEQTHRIAAQAQFDLLPIISGCILGMMVLTLMRDLALTSVPMSFPVLAYYLVTYVLLVTIWILSQGKNFPVEWSHAAGVVCLSCVAVNPIIQYFTGVQVGPLYFAAALFAGGLSILSVRHLFVLQLLLILLWLSVNLQSSTLVQLLPLFFMNLISSGLGIVTLKKRLGTLIRIHSLESRVEALESILPMCAGCKKTCNDNGDWVSVENYIESHEQGVSITHAMCPECMKNYYGDVLAKKNREQPSSD